MGKIIFLRSLIVIVQKHGQILMLHPLHTSCNLHAGQFMGNKEKHYSLCL